MFNNIFLILVFFSSTANSAEYSCSNILESDLHKSLYTASKNDYNVRAMTGLVNGISRSVILVGEIHFKNTENAFLGQEIVNNSDYIGFEGIDPSLTWGGKIKDKVFSPIKKIAKIKDKPQFWLIQSLAKLFGKGIEGSTVNEALIAEAREQMKQNLMKMAPEERMTFITNLLKVPENDRNAILPINGIKLFSIQNLIDWLNEIDSGLTLERRGPIDTFHLEDGHHPDFWENADSVQPYLTFGLLAAYFSSIPFLPDNMISGAGAGIMSWFSYSLAGIILSDKHLSKPWFKRIFPLSLGVLRARNATMINNVEATLLSNDKIKELVVIVGKSHIPEMVELLLNQGFVESDLLTPQEMSSIDETANF